MKTKLIEVCNAKHIFVVTGYNDLADIKCGGTATLGYDFYISPDENIDNLIIKIKKWLKKYHRKYNNIGLEYDRIDFPIKSLITEKDIEECIKKEYPF